MIWRRRRAKREAELASLRAGRCPRCGGGSVVALPHLIVRSEMVEKVIGTQAGRWNLVAESQLRCETCSFQRTGAPACPRCRGDLAIEAEDIVGWEAGLPGDSFFGTDINSVTCARCGFRVERTARIEPSSDDVYELV